MSVCINQYSYHGAVDEYNSARILQGAMIICRGLQSFLYGAIFNINNTPFGHVHARSGESGKSPYGVDYSGRSIARDMECMPVVTRPCVNIMFSTDTCTVVFHG